MHATTWGASSSSVPSGLGLLQPHRSWAATRPWPWQSTGTEIAIIGFPHAREPVDVDFTCQRLLSKRRKMQDDAEHFQSSQLDASNGVSLGKLKAQRLVTSALQNQEVATT